MPDWVAGEEEYKRTCRNQLAIQQSAPQRSQQRNSAENLNFSISRDDLCVSGHRDYRQYSPEKAIFLGERSGMFADTCAWRIPILPVLARDVQSCERLDSWSWSRICWRSSKSSPTCSQPSSEWPCQAGFAP